MNGVRPAILIFCLLPACGTSDSNKTTAAADCPDGCCLEPTPAEYSYPAGPYGTQVGDKFQNFELDDCDGNPVAFDQLLSHAELVLFNVGAGWCQPCIEETRTLEAKVFAPFCGRGLRVVQVLFEDQDARPTTSLFCKQWRDANGLTFPVLKDPLFTTDLYFQDHVSQTPVNLLVDKHGVIQHREVGTPAADLPQRIDDLLPP